MAKMGSPYLESGESLILTTDRVSVNTVQYDVLLTTRYLILVDVRYDQFQPQMIPLLTIQSVKGGKTANGELVITLFFTETGSSGKSESMVLLFSQQPGEQRKRERDEWLKTLMGLVVSVRQETSYDSLTTADPEIGIRPSKRRQISPEIPHPYTKVVETRSAQIELIIIPDEPEFPVFSEGKQKLPDMAFPGEETESEVTPAPCVMEETPGASQELTESSDTILPSIPVFEETTVDSQEVEGSLDTISPPIPAFEETPVDSQEVERLQDAISPPLPVFEGTPDAAQEVDGSPYTLSPPEVPIIVESALVHEEESESHDTVTLVPAFEEIPGAPEADSGTPKSVTVSLLAAVKSLSSPQGRTGLPDMVLPPRPGIEAIPGASPEVTGSPDTLLPPEVPKIVASSYTQEEKQEEKAEPILPPETSTIEKKPVASHEDTVSPDLPTSPELLTVESPAVPGQDSPLAELMSPGAGKMDESVQQPAPEATPHTPGSPPPSAGPGSRRQTFIAVAAIILIILGIAGVLIFYPQNSTAPSVEPIPLLTPTIQQSPQTTPVIMPTTGVWVRVGYPRNYYGWVGNTGSMRGVTGSGDQIYKIPESDSIVQVQIHKEDNSGDTLTVEVYRDGDVMSHRTVSIPMGSIELLIDAKTGNPPGMIPVVTPSNNQTGSSGGRIMYF
jgi:hypothetical protein